MSTPFLLYESPAPVVHSLCCSILIDKLDVICFHSYYWVITQYLTPLTMRDNAILAAKETRHDLMR